MALPSYGGPVSNGASAAPAPNPLFQRVQEFLAARNNRLPGNLSEPVSHAPIDVGIHGFGPDGPINVHPVEGPVRAPESPPVFARGLYHPRFAGDLRDGGEPAPLQMLLRALGGHPESFSSRAVHGRNKALVGHNAMRLPNY